MLEPNAATLLPVIQAAINLYWGPPNPISCVDLGSFLGIKVTGHTVTGVCLAVPPLPHICARFCAYIGTRDITFDSALMIHTLLCTTNLSHPGGFHPPVKCTGNVKVCAKCFDSSVVRCLADICGIADQILGCWLLITSTSNRRTLSAVAKFVRQVLYSVWPSRRNIHHNG